MLSGFLWAVSVSQDASASSVVAAHWNGFYAGANAGGTWGKSQTESPLTSPGCATAVCYIQSVVDDINNMSARTLRPSGFTGGVQAGYNVQSGNLVFGGEADFGVLRLRQTNTQTAFFNCCPPPGSPATYTNSISTSWLLTARGRLGFAANNWLLYATGGVALTRVAYGHTYVEGTAGGATGLETATASATRTGYVVGGGLEMTWDQSWSLKAEYLYLDFGSISTGPVPLGSSAQTVFGHVFNHSATLTANVVRVGLNYKFR